MSLLACTTPYPQPRLGLVPRRRSGRPHNVVRLRPKVLAFTIEGTPASCQIPDIVSLIPLATKIAKWFERRWGLPAGWDLEDLVQDGLVGLVKAAARFDPTRGCSIETYAGYAIRGAIFRKITERWEALNSEAPPPSEEIESSWPLLPETAVYVREVVDVVDRLSVAEQTLVYGVAEENTISDLARLLDVPVATAFRWHRKATQKVRTAVCPHPKPAALPAS